MVAEDARGIDGRQRQAVLSRVAVKTAVKPLIQARNDPHAGGLFRIEAEYGAPGVPIHRENQRPLVPKI